MMAPVCYATSPDFALLALALLALALVRLALAVLSGGAK
jgi:hypothetical protein